MYLTRLVLLLHLMSWWTSADADPCGLPPCLFSLCEAPTGCMRPLNPYGFFGHNITINCTLINSNRSSDLYFSWKNDINISQAYQRVISPTTLRLNMPITENDRGTMVLCTLPGNEPFFQWLEVEYFPRKVSSWKAVVNDWKNLSISWDPGPYINQNNVNLRVQWISADTDIWRACSDLTWPSNPTVCVLDSSVYNHSLQYIFNITVTNTKKHVSVNTVITLEPELYVKPAPVTSLQVFNVTSRCAELQWRHHMESSKSLVYGLLFLQGGVEISNQTFDEVSARICDLHPYMSYNVMVRVKSVRGGYWSDPDSISFTTQEDKPDFGANVTAGAFRADDCSNGNMRNVTIFLKTPSAEYWNGKLTNYTVSLFSDGRANVTHVQPITQVMDVVIGLDCTMDHVISISVSNNAGSSTPSLLRIPEHGIIPQPMNVRVGVNDSSIRVHWKSALHTAPLSWTVFWCQGSFLNCSEPLSWIIVDGKETSSLVPFTRENMTTYLFAVSMTTDKGSSGMTMPECLYDVHKPLERENKPQIQVDSEPSLALTVKWSLRVCKDAVLITSYIIQHCPNNITEECVTESVSSDHTEHVIPNLKEGVAYMVRLKQVTVAGEEGEFSDPVFGVPVKNSWKSVVIAGIVIGCLVIPVVIVIVVILAYRKWNEREMIDVPCIVQDYPGFDSQAPDLPVRLQSITILQVEDDHNAVSLDRAPRNSVLSDHMTEANGQAHPVQGLEQDSSVMDSGEGTVVTLLSSYELSVGFTNGKRHPEHEGEVGTKLGFSNNAFDDEFDPEDHDSAPYVVAGSEAVPPQSGKGSVANAGESSAVQGLKEQNPNLSGGRLLESQSTSDDYVDVGDACLKAEVHLDGKSYPDSSSSTHL